MRALVTGVKGQLGHDVMNELAKRGYEGVGVDVEEMDITDAAVVDSVIREAKVDSVVHCAAWTAVDAAEDNEEMCRKVNAEGTENIAKVCKALDIPMIYISTDYVFEGEGTLLNRKLTTARKLTRISENQTTIFRNTLSIIFLMCASYILIHE